MHFRDDPEMSPKIHLSEDVLGVIGLLLVDCFEPVLFYLGPVLAHLGPVLVLLGPVMPHLGLVLVHLGSWKAWTLGGIWRFWPFWEPKMMPKT